ncbi:TonB-dependent receptor plug domain-containing protein [Hydrocarboniphaga sp.]|uniref:TonB-dependent receptor plug domain-containing protein n=1 Tax=Hydrocarboniphaga sp. TaxID=2033016 RepID=UPI003D09AA3E
MSGSSRFSYPLLLCRLSTALLVAWPAGSRAADDAAPVELAPVVVEGERSELQDSGVVIRVPVAPLGASDLAELLASLPGVQVRSSGGLGSYSEASLRGSSGRQVRVLLDGLPLDTGGGEASSLSLISPLLLDEVDVYKGRVPVGLGSGLAGTINLRSRRELAAPVVGAATIGSYGQRQLDVAGQLSDSLQLALGGQAADNDFRYVNPYKPFDPNDPDRTAKEERQNAATRQYYGLLRYRGPIEVTAHVVDDMQQLPTRLNADDSDAELDTRSYALSLASPEDAAWQSALSHRYTRETFRDPDSQVGLGAQGTVSDTQRTLASLGRRFDKLQDTLSVEHTEYSAEDQYGNLPTRSARRSSIGNGIAYQSGEAFKYNASLQAGWSRDDAGGEHDAHWQFEPAVGANQRFGACTAAANLGHRQRLPTFFERYGDRGLFRGNPALDPESANYADLGARCVPGNRFQRLELTLFGQDLHDAISPTYNAQGVGRSVNTDRALIYGVELDSAGAALGFGWQLGGTWQHTEDRSDVRATRGQQLPGRFETQLNARIERSWRQIIFHYAYRLEAGAYYDSANLLKSPELQRHDVGARGAIGTLGWSLQALNLGDDRVEQFNGYPAPGRRVLLSLSFPYQASAPPPDFDSQHDTTHDSMTRGVSNDPIQN